MWHDRRILDLFGIDEPILLAPMAGSGGAQLAIAVSRAGGLGALPCALLSHAQIRAELGIIRQHTDRPINLNFFCHRQPLPDAAAQVRWHRRLAPYYAEFGLDPAAAPAGPGRNPFDEGACEIVEEYRPEVVSFHFGLPEEALLARVRATGARIVASATTVAEARWLEEKGCDAIVAQGAEAGGHRGIFLEDDIATQPGTMALVPQVVDAVSIPVIAAGGIADGRGIAAAFMLGAAGVQLGTAYLQCPEALTSPVHRAALAAARDDRTVLTNVFTGRPARGLANRVVREIGPISPDAPAFPLATAALMPLRRAAEEAGSGDFSPLWAGQAAALAKPMPAGELTSRLARDAAALLKAAPNAAPA
ncbi:NAD(P)H-dependent flavin oxidoreductase [Chelativorans intermedius]|uniref:Propionate 3-nitronate monooxygenase n=1 Tax=Chelativorans intermedius TaxID=515947 RepID=A0ABV6DAT0_9HYPH|nr:nitronate monooxygenase family protein [Chelativorans intermedius]MCT8997995.1 nitronate monooxygenase family protein [Chelativorans intermedius]